MEMQCPYAAVVAAERAASPGLRDENELHLASALTYTLHAAPLASVVAATLEPKLRHAMPTTLPHHRSLAGGLGSACGPLAKPPLLGVCLQAMVPAPYCPRRCGRRGPTSALFRADFVPTLCLGGCLHTAIAASSTRGAKGPQPCLSPVSSSTRPYARSNSRLTSARCWASSLMSPLSCPRAR
jgi:hypothetical protein